MFNTRLIPPLERNKEIPHEIIGGRRGHSIVYMVLNKKLVSDYSNQIKHLIVVASTETSNYYDYIIQPFLSISSQYFSLQLEYLLLLFGTIQSIKMFLRTSFRILSKYYTGIVSKPF